MYGEGGFRALGSGKKETFAEDERALASCRTFILQKGKYFACVFHPVIFFLKVTILTSNSRNSIKYSKWEMSNERIFLSMAARQLNDDGIGLYILFRKQKKKNKNFFQLQLSKLAVRGDVLRC